MICHAFLGVFLVSYVDELLWVTADNKEGINKQPLVKNMLSADTQSQYSVWHGNLPLVIINTTGPCSLLG